MGQGAYIFGCEGHTLTSSEKTFFRDSDPWGFILFARNIETPDQLRALTSQLRDTVGRDAPILIDQEGGRVQRLTPPHWRAYLPPLDQRSKEPERAMWLRGRLIAQELYELGIDVNCAPLLDVAQDDTHPFLRNRCYSADPEQVVALGGALTNGMLAGGVLPVMKHIPGHGRAVMDSHHELPRTDVTRERLAQDFAPFKALAGLPMAMTGHVLYEAIDPDQPATLSHACIDLIRNEIGFEGLLMTDDLSMKALSGTVSERATGSLAAGCDILLHCNGEMAEMEAVAAVGTLSTAAQTRADDAIAARTQNVPVDIPALEREFQSLIE